MSRWRYRVIRHEEMGGAVWYGIHEVYEDDQGAVVNWGDAVAEPHEADAPDFLRDTLTLMLAAFDLPVLREDGDTLVEVES